MNHHNNTETQNEPLLSYVEKAFEGSLLNQPAREPIYQLLRVMGGTGKIVIDEREFEMLPGRVILITPWQLFEFIALDALRVVHIVFSADMLTKLYGDILIDRIQMYSPEHSKQYVDIDPCRMVKVDALQTILKEEVEDTTANPNTKRAIFCAYLCVLSEMIGGGQPKRQEAFRVELLMNLIAEFYTDQHNVEFYAEKMSLTAKQLNNTAKSSTGYTVSQLIQNHIVLEAKRRIIASDDGVKTIALSLGFQDPSHFSRFFRRHVGKSPKEYRLLASKP